MLAGKRILLIVSGGIAAYKTLELIRRLRERGAAVRCILTRGGAEFVTPLSLAAISGETLLGLRLELEGYTAARTGLILAFHAVGFVLGSIFAERIIRRVGHIRAFAVFGALALQH